jgi:hypothetical protein
VPFSDWSIPLIITKIHHWHKACQSDRDAQVQNALTTGARIGSTAATSMAQLGTGLVQEGAAASRFMTRAGTNLALSARFARFAGGALSAATLVLEGATIIQNRRTDQEG